MTEPETATVNAAIDLNRGVIMRTHRQSGITVCMYKDDPGVYLDENGHEIGESFARDAGFDVDTLDKQKERNEAMAKAIANVNREYESEKNQIVFEAGGFKVRHEEAGRHSVLDAEDLIMSRDHSRGDAINIVRQLAASDVEPETEKEDISQEAAEAETSPDKGEDVGDPEEQTEWR